MPVYKLYWIGGPKIHAGLHIVIVNSMQAIIWCNFSLTTQANINANNNKLIAENVCIIRFIKHCKLATLLGLYTEIIQMPNF